MYFVKFLVVLRLVSPGTFVFCPVPLKYIQLETPVQYTVYSISAFGGKDEHTFLVKIIFYFYNFKVKKSAKKIMVFVYQKIIFMISQEPYQIS